MQFICTGTNIQTGEEVAIKLVSRLRLGVWVGETLQASAGMWEQVRALMSTVSLGGLATPVDLTGLYHGAPNLTGVGEDPSPAAAVRVKALQDPAGWR